MKGLKAPFHSFLIPRELRAERLPEAFRFLNEHLSARTSATACRNPIFILSAGWRSGSTLLQRLICSDKDVMLWGEPFGDTIPVPRLAATVENFTLDNPYTRYAIDQFSGEFSNEWIANLNPGLEEVRRAHLAFFETLFARPAHGRGYTRWGVKWVRLTAEHGLYLKWLYPEAKFLLLVRHPLLAYQSYRGNRWYTIRPDYPMTGIVKFLGHWCYLAASFLRLRDALDGKLIRYEDLIGESSLVQELTAYLNIKLESKVLKRKIDARQDKKPLGWHEQFVCQILAGNICRKLGYRTSGEVLAMNNA